MKRRFFVTLICGLLAISCAMEQDSANEITTNGKVKVSIGQSVKIKSRTTVDSDGRTAIWEGDDKIAVWAQGSDGNFDLTGERFILYRFTNSMTQAIFTAYITPMEEDNYTYYAAYPTPTAINGTEATFSLSAVQSGEEFVGDCDIMVSAPIQSGALTAESVTPLDLRFSHKMHAMRFDIPEDGNLMGMAIDKIEFTFPTNVVGDVTLDVANPDAAPTLSNGSNVLTLDLPNGAEAGDTLWAMIFPTELTGEITYKAYSGKYSSVEGRLEIIKTAEAQHMTRTDIQIPELYRMTTISLKVVENNLGEDFNTMTILDASGNTMCSFTKNSSDVYDFKVEGVYDVSPWQGQTLTARFDSPNAIIDYKFTMPNNMLAYTKTSADVKIPYLLFEDFSASSDAESQDAYAASTDDVQTNAPGQLLDGKMPRNGWNAARFKISGGNRIRINCHYDSAVMSYARYSGRLDTPAIGHLKSNNVPLKVTYDVGCYIPMGYQTLSSFDDTKSGNAYYIVGTHTKSDTSKLDGVNQDKVSSNCTTIFTSNGYKTNDSLNFTSPMPETVSHTIANCGASTRIVWWACTKQTKVVFQGANARYYFYIDNIKVQIAK
ncbi:MAG: fimbrillin family protein [Alistipes sp.]|nr:fimbrillin family protein [Alistipes sp.]